MAKPLFWNAINPMTGLPFVWNDPNVRWGFYLEPGDPGFVPYPPQTITKHTRTMRLQAYYPSKVADQIIWLGNFYAKLIGYIATLGLDASRAAGIIADCRWLIYVLGTWLPAVRAWQKACTDAAQQAQGGTGGTLALPVFTPPPLPAATGGLPAVVPMPEGSLRRIFDLVGEIKQNDARTDAILADLRVVGAETDTPDPADFQPVITARVSGLQVELGWNWDGLRDHVEALHMQVDRADGKGFVTLCYDTTPNCTDTAPFPATRTAWSYRGMWQVDGAPVGKWSETVSVVVGG